MLAATEHTYQRLFHVHPNFTIRKCSEAKYLVCNNDSKNSMYIVSNEVEDLKGRIVIGEENPIQGWYSIDHRKKQTAPALILDQQFRSGGTMITLLFSNSVEQVNESLEIRALKPQADASFLVNVSDAETFSHNITIWNKENQTDAGTLPTIKVASIEKEE